MSSNLFSNQTTNLSTLSTALTDLCRKLEAPKLEAPGSVKPENKRKEDQLSASERRIDKAEDFLDALAKRVDNVDEALMKSTEHLLPTLSGRGESSRMTATELSQVLSSLHGIHARQIQRFASSLGDVSILSSASSSEQQQGEEMTRSGDTPYHWSLGMPLEKVVEMDNETDRCSYGSMTSMRSLSFSHTPGGKGPSTPLTPSINGLRLSQSTKKILTHEDEDYDSPELNKTLNRSTHSIGENEFGRSPANVAEKATSTAYDGGLEKLTKYHSGVLDPPQRDNIERVSQHSEGAATMLSRLLQDDDSEAPSTLCSTVVVEDRGQSTPEMVEMTDHNFNDRNTTDSPTIDSGEGDDEQASDEDNDEVTTLCPTVLANASFEGGNLHDEQNHQNPNSRRMDQDIFSPQTDLFGRSKIFRNNQHDISHVVVQPEASPSQTMLTMDATMFLHDNDAASQSSRLVNDAASLGEETPVLDRYRIIQDDNSTGFKVLPNERGSQLKIRNSASRTPAGDESMSDNDMIPRSVKFREKPYVREEHSSSSFRKTPHPGRKAGLTEMVGSPLLELGDSMLNKENSVEITGLPKVQFSTTPRDKENRAVFRKTPFHNNNESTAKEVPLKRSVAFESPGIEMEAESRNFRKTPFRTVREDEERGRTIRFDTSDQAFEAAITPLKDKPQTYRKTPHARAAEKLSIESLKFAPGTQFECSTPGRREGKPFRKTPYAKDSSDDNGMRAAASPMVYFEQRSREFSTLTPLRGGEAFRKSPYRRLLKPTSPTIEESGLEANLVEPKGSMMRIPLVDIPSAKVTANDQAFASPVSMASTISQLTGVTGLTYTENQRELFPPVNDSPGDDPMAGRKSVSSLIPKINEREFEAGEVKQFSLDETNCAITALNGAAFLRRESGDPSLRFTDAEAYKILRNVGFKRRKCKGILMALCHWGRLAMKEEDDAVLGMPIQCFEAITGDAVVNQ